MNPRTEELRTGSLRARLEAAGAALGTRLAAVVDALALARGGPQELAERVGGDKVFASRLLKALRAEDALAVAYRVPGREPLRRFLRSAGRQGVDPALRREAERAVDAFDELVREQFGDRSALHATVSAWLPEARVEFELRRKQSAHRATSELKGVVAETILATAIFHPSARPGRLDVVWIAGLLGLRRLRPGVAAKLDTRRLAGRSDAEGSAERHPATLGGERVEGLVGLRLDDFCLAPPAPVEVRRAGDCVHYVLAGDAFGPGAGHDLILAEVNRAEIAARVPAGSGRKGHAFAEVSTPARRMVFDVLLHRDVYPGAEPVLRIYDMVPEGPADPNDPARDVDRLDLAEEVRPLAGVPDGLAAPGVPRYPEMIDHVLARVGWSGAELRGYRSAIDYPVYGSQLVQAFDPPQERAGSPGA